MYNVNFMPKDVRSFLSSHKMFEKYNEQEVFCKKNVFLKISQYSQESTCVFEEKYKPSGLELY